jgi:hypothetical protein
MQFDVRVPAAMQRAIFRAVVKCGRPVAAMRFGFAAS